MGSSEPAITNDIRARLAVGYEPARDDRAWSEGDPLLPATWLETATADGAIASTAADMAIFVRMILDEGTGPNGPLISSASFAQMLAPVPSINDQGYGLGIYSREFDHRRMIGHTGGMVGYLAGLWCDPDAGLGAVVLQNGPGHGPNMLARRVLQIVAAARAGLDPGAALDANLAALAAADAAGAAKEAEADETRAASPRRDVADPELESIVGTYRSHDPWTTNFRVELRCGVPWLCFWAAPDGFDEEQPLMRSGREGYRVGDDPLGPERVRFDTVIGGRAIRAWLSGWDYYRVGDP